MFANNDGYLILTPEDVMEELCIGKNTVYALLSSGELKAFKIGTKWKIPKKALDDYIDKNITQKGND
mgnify:FL=1